MGRLLSEDNTQSSAEMASLRCHACGATISSDDKSCGTCGAPKISYLELTELMADADLLSLFGPDGERLIGGRYRLLEKFAHGSTGSVFRALDVNLDRAVAIKFLSTSSADGMDLKTRRLRLQTEGRILGLLKHPNLITIYEMCDEDGVLCIVMELVEGSPLKSFLEGGEPFSTSDAVDIAIRICDGVEHAHKNGVVHRDLKPSNIILLEGDEVKIADFGIAKVAFGAAAETPGIIIGTPYYMSPEQLLGITVDARSDIFAVGAMLYQMVTGRRPFEGQNLTEIVRRITSSEFVKPRQRNLEVPERLEMIIERALIKNRELRYQSIKRMKDDLLAFRRGAPISEDPQPPRSFNAQTQTSEKRNKTKSERSWTVTFWVVIISVLVAALILFVVFKPHDSISLKRATSAILEAFADDDFGDVYARLSDDFRSRFSLKEFTELPFLGFQKPPKEEPMIYDVQRLVFLNDGHEANVIVSVRYSRAVRASRYTMRWVKEGGAWHYQNPEYERYRTMVKNNNL
ncbi:protein kinase [bacterium]|nr:protein kinase [bacterium]